MKWNHILIEGFCARMWGYHSKSSKHVYKLKKIENPDLPLDWEKEPNPKYDPKVKKPRRPKYCKKKICIECIKCKHLAYGEVPDDFLKRFKDMTHQYFQEEHDD